MQIQDLVFFTNRHVSMESSGLIQPRETPQTPRRRRARLSPLGLGPPGPGYDTGPDAPRPSSHARRQGLGSPRAIGTHMRRPRLRKCSLSLLFCPFISSVPVNAARSPIRDFRRFCRVIANPQSRRPPRYSVLTSYRSSKIHRGPL